MHFYLERICNLVMTAVMVFQFASNPPPPRKLEDFLGNFGWGGGLGSETLGIRADGTFQYDAWWDFGPTIEWSTGTWINLKDTVFLTSTLKPKIRTIKESIVQS